MKVRLSDLAAMPKAERAATLRALVEETRRPIELPMGPLTAALVDESQPDGFVKVLDSEGAVRMFLTRAEWDALRAGDNDGT